ncbi:hypothetical protein PFISCL1PPCAC_5751, partial [Pristionchus fissidentatus]
AQSKNVNFLYICNLGLSMVLMTIDILILLVELSLAPDSLAFPACPFLLGWRDSVRYRESAEKGGHGNRGNI